MYILIFQREPYGVGRCSIFTTTLALQENFCYKFLKSMYNPYKNPNFKFCLDKCN